MLEKVKDSNVGNVRFFVTLRFVSQEISLNLSLDLLLEL